jgi:type IV pilus assembly protein PilM
MFGKDRQSVRPIALDLGHSTIRMLQLGVSSDEDLYVVEAQQTHVDPELDAQPHNREEFVSESIRRMLDQGRFVGRKVISALPNDSLKIRSLRLDPGQTGQIDQILRDEVAQRFGLNPDTDEIRYLIAGNAYQGDEIKNEVIFFGIDRVSLEQHLQMLQKAMLEPQAIDAVPCALFRSFKSSYRRQEDQQLVSVFVEVGCRLTTVIIGRGQEISFIKQIPIAGDQINQDVAQRLGISLPEAIRLRSQLRTATDEAFDHVTRQSMIDAMSRTVEDLAKEVSLCFRYYAVTFRGEKPQEAVFGGGEAHETALLNALRRHLGIEITIAQPFRGIDLTGSMLAEADATTLSEWAVAVGLGIRGFEPAMARVENAG